MNLPFPPPLRAPRRPPLLLLAVLAAPYCLPSHAIEPSAPVGTLAAARQAVAVNRQNSTNFEESAPPLQTGEAERPVRQNPIGAHRSDNLIDPFEVSPQLRDGRRGMSAVGSLPTANKLDLRRRIQVKAMLITPEGRAAQLEIDGARLPGGVRGKNARAGSLSSGDVLTVMDGELVDFGELGIYIVRISARDGVTLVNPGNPQTGRISLR